MTNVNSQKCGLWAESSELACPLAQDCSRGNVFAQLVRITLTEGRGKEEAGCHDFNMGYYCGSALAYYEAAVLSTQLAELDERSPVTHYARLIDVPAGPAQLEVRQAIKGMSFYLREALQPEDATGALAVHPLDFMLALHNAGKINEAASYRKYAADQAAHGLRVEHWLFSAAEMAVSACNARSTAEDYGMSAWLPSMLGSVWRGYILPHEFFAPGSEAGQKLFVELQEKYGPDKSNSDLVLLYIKDMLGQMSLTSLVERGSGRTTTYDTEAHEVVRVVDAGGVVVFDKATGVGSRPPHPETE